MEVITQNVSNKRTVFGLIRVASSEVEIEEVVRSPEVEGLREIKNQLIQQCRFGLTVTIAPKSVRHQSSEHDEGDDRVDIDFRLFDYIFNNYKALRPEDSRERDYANANPAPTHDQ